MDLKELLSRPDAAFTCPNPECDCFRQSKRVRRHGFSGTGKKYRRFLCKSCRTTFSELHGTALADTKLPIQTALSVLEHVQEGCGTRKTARLVKVDKDTVTRLIRLAGGHARNAHDELVAVSPSHPGGPARREVELRPTERGAPARGRKHRAAR